jgi:multidrug efflux pump subunit AcrA (membrane-fusion protein)
MMLRSRYNFHEGGEEGERGWVSPDIRAAVERLVAALEEEEARRAAAEAARRAAEAAREAEAARLRAAAAAAAAAEAEARRRADPRWCAGEVQVKKYGVP